MSENSDSRVHRPLFSSRLAFVFAASASAIGLGNLWRFPALAARYGGGAFLLTYLVLVVTFGFTLMIAEIALGRSTRQSAIGAYRKLNRRFAIVGTLTMLVPIIILPYYCVIGGWILRYIGVYLAGQGAAAADGGSFFATFIASPFPVLAFTALFLLATMLVVGVGLRNGIERLNSILMPALILLAAGLGVYALTIPGALDGLAYYLVPHPEDFGLATVIAAMGQMFFSLSLAMGIMVTYGSYLSRDEDMETGVRRIELFDTVVALLAGFMIVPAVFAFGGIEAARQAGPSLMFITMPQIFGGQPVGQVVGLLFFALVLFAALTSAVSIAETIVSIVIDRFGWSRKKAVVIVLLLVLVLAAAPALGFSVLSDVTLPLGGASMSILDIMDFLSNSILMPLVALLTCLFVGYWLKPDFVFQEAETTAGIRFKAKWLFRVMIRYVAPAFLLLIFISSVLNAIGVIAL
ncbi:MAG: sodium-dependent transporter [Coriobacteriales bacterium]|nr:sodium-dependent transporter [Coriobacteriales bacterium]